MEEMEKVICKIRFYNEHIDEPRAIFGEITSEIMSHAFDYVFENRRFLFVSNLEGAGCSASIEKCDEGYVWEFVDEKNDDEWYCEARVVYLEKLEKIISQTFVKETKHFKWLASPYTSAPFRNYDPEAEWVWNEIKQSKSYSKFIAEIKENPRQGAESLSEWRSFKSLVYTLAESNPALAFELISLNQKGEDVLNEGIKALQLRCHYWLLKQGFVSNLVSYSDSGYSYSDGVIELYTLEFFVHLNQWRTVSNKFFSRTLAHINKVLNECLLGNFSLPIESLKSGMTYDKNNKILSLTLPINLSNPNHPKTLGEIKLEFEVFGKELVNAFKEAEQEEIYQYLLDCYHKVDYTQNDKANYTPKGVFAETNFSLTNLTWVYQNRKIVLVD